MSTPISISIPHHLGRVEARRRIESGFAKMVDLIPGGSGPVSQHWDGDRLTFRIAAMGQSIGGVVNVLDASVTMEIELPGILGMLANRLKDKLRTAGQRLLTKR